jgi:hypothetical protein
MELSLDLSLRPRQEIVIKCGNCLLEYAQVLPIPIIPSFSILIQVNISADTFCSRTGVPFLSWGTTIQIEKGFLSLQP